MIPCDYSFQWSLTCDYSFQWSLTRGRVDSPIEVEVVQNDTIYIMKIKIIEELCWWTIYITKTKKTEKVIFIDTIYIMKTKKLNMYPVNKRPNKIVFRKIQISSKRSFQTRQHSMVRPLRSTGGRPFGRLPKLLKFIGLISSILRLISSFLLDGLKTHAKNGC